MTMFVSPKATIKDLTLQTASLKEQRDKSVCIYLYHWQTVEEFEIKSQKRSKIPISWNAGICFDFS